MGFKQYAMPLLVGLSLAISACSAGDKAEQGNEQAVSDPLNMTNEERAKVQQAGAEILFWSDEKRANNFREMEKHFPGTVAKKSEVRTLEKGEPLNFDDATIKSFMDETQVAGFMVLQDGKIRYEAYGLDFNATGRWTSFSVAKSFTSTLVGMAIKDGYIKSVDDPVVKYVPELKGSGYDKASVKNILTMSSGVQWNEDYTDPNSDVVKMFQEPLVEGKDPNVAYMAKLKSEAEPGTRWQYNTGETNLIGIIVQRATKKRLSEYAQEKLMGAAGFEDDMFWMVDTIGQNIGGCCLSLRLSDYARMGQFAMEGGKDLVPDGWFADASKEHYNIGAPGFGYGYQWWTYPDNMFGAKGIFGQAIIIAPEEKMVVAIVSNWPVASDDDLRMRQLKLANEIRKSLSQ